MKPVPITPLRTKRLLLQPASIDFADSYQLNFSDFEVIRYLNAAVPWPYPSDGAYMFLQDVILPSQSKDRWCWVLTLKNYPEEAIGGIELFRDARPENRGFWLGRRYWGQGLMTEAVEVVNDFAFEKLTFEILILSNAVGNHRSRRIKEKTGARFLRTKPANFVDPRFTKSEIWELNRSSWSAFKTSSS